MEPMTNPEAQTASGGARLKKGSAKTPLIVLGVIVAVLAAGYLGLCAFALHHSTIWQETFVLGVNIGGMTEEEAAQAVSNALPDMQISLYLCRLRMRRFPFPTWTHRLMSPPWSRVPTPPSAPAPSSLPDGGIWQATACPTPEIRRIFR